MGCFLPCFGSSKDRKHRAQRKKRVLPQDQRHGSHRPLQPSAASGPEFSAAPTNLVSEQPVEEQLSLNTRKKVTFDTNVKTYEPVPVRESNDSLPETGKETNKKEEESSGKSSLSHSLSEDESTISSVGSYPPNHRYRNCRDSDDEAEELECEDSDLDEEDEELEDYDDYDDDDEYEETKIAGQEVWSEEIPTASMESSTEISSARTVTEEVDSPLTKRNARDRSVYVHSVLNPVENLSQWKAVKSKGAPPLKPQKENFIRTEQEAPRVSFSSEPLIPKPKSDKFKNQNQEMAVDASLSNWLVSPETITASNRSISQCSSSVVTIEDRPILGALTVEEIRQFSASSSSPRRSPSRSPDEMPIIGTVGRYWSHSESAMDSGSASSNKGIPNTTSKYREDKRVNWQSTPFETRLETALNGTMA